MTHTAHYPIRKVLIANRGEIACRVIKTAKQLGISTLAIYSTADANSMHVNMADEAFCVGNAPSQESYLRGERIIKIALENNVDAIHPGYGFLSENADFAQQCKENNIIFIGPPVEAILAMGSKSAAKRIMQEAGVPLVPGYHGDNQDPSFLKDQAIKMGFPVLLKAAAGGGGKGMREVWSEADFDHALDAAKRESKASFDDDIMLIEKFLTQPRHVEIQVFCDNHGNGVYLFERDCSIQRRHQKVIEEAPAPNLPKGVREQMGEAALKAAHAINYTGAGTVEFLLDVDGSFYFMEMNTRLQVEHPVTEMITGEDLVAWQLTVASNKRLPKSQDQLTLNGHAIEARVYAEDPENEFLPSTGTLTLLRPPAESEHIRVDTGVIEGDEVSIYYDPMIAKLIVWGSDREQAINLLSKSLEHYAIGGVATNISYLKRIAESDAFNQADLCTQFIKKNETNISTYTSPTSALSFQCAALAWLLQRSKKPTDAKSEHNPWANTDGFRLNTNNTETLNFIVNDEPKTISVAQIDQQTWSFKEAVNSTDNITVSGEFKNNELSGTINEQKIKKVALIKDAQIDVYSTQGIETTHYVAPDLGINNEEDHAGGVEAPMNGTVVDMLVEAGDTVEKGQVVAIVEAMKMEHAIKAPFNGTIKECFFTKGDLVDGGAALIDLCAEDA